MSKSGIVNVRMVITEEKILSNIDKIQKMLNPNSKKQIIQLEEDSYFKDLIDSIKSYLIEYPKKRNFPVSVYKAAYALVETATNQFEENTQRIEELIRQREENIALAGEIKELIVATKAKKKGWRDEVKAAEDDLPEEIIEALNILGKSKSVKSEDYQDSLKLLNARVNNLESNLHIEIDMERIEDRSKALSYIGIEIADALKVIPAPVEEKKHAVVFEEEPEIEMPVKVARTAKVAKPAKVVENIKPEKISKVERTERVARHEKVAKTERVERAAQHEKVVRAERVERTVRPEKAVRAERVERPIRPEKVVRNERMARPIIPAQEVEEYEEQEQLQAYKAQTTFRRKHSLWQKIKDSKFMRAATYIFRIKIRIELPNALPEGRGENY